ncbi:MAG: GHMP kinase [Cytophagaceae bacterium]|nr:GHMP kinase [Cytophagaceae bacterium]
MSTSLTVSTPGRICLFGEHQDYLGLPVIAAAISRRVQVAGTHREDKTIHIALPDVDSSETIKLNGRIEYTKKRDYFRSGINVLQDQGLTFSKGLECSVHGTIPINSGTSSSSALLASWIHFLIRMSDQVPDWNRQRIGELAYQAEVLEFKEAGGMMDQYSTAVGHVIYLESTPQIHIEEMNPHFGSFVLGDSGEPKDTQGILGRLRNGVNAIVGKIRLVNPAYSLFTTSETETTEFKDHLTKEEYHLLKGTISNRDILREALNVLRAAELNHVHFGTLLSQHHRNLRDAQQISTPKIERMIGAALEAGALGAKINGSGGGGCMFAYAPKNADAVAQAIERQGGKAYIITVDEGTRVENK